MTMRARGYRMYMYEQSRVIIKRRAQSCDKSEAQLPIVPRTAVRCAESGVIHDCGNAHCGKRIVIEETRKYTRRREKR